ncbi:hypothetical protein HYT17_02245, partial [Candidatus Microgenomates bacterium]|nr:hypothetical protein [Candidatus Microgenomates bacterium]
AAGGQELLLSALQNKTNWEKTGRWSTFDVLFKVNSQYQTQYALGPTHEEVLVPIVKHFVSSYQDLPLYLYQIQNKFRDEPRTKAGLLRGREFLMKDLYSFHTDEEDFNKYYELMKKVYKKVFERCGLSAIETEASGGTFSKFSHEYQVLTPSGEDEIIYCEGGDFSQNVEIAQVAEGKQCDLGHGPLKRAKTIEVGNIFPLKTKFSEAFGLTYKDKEGKEQLVIMGCYGIGISRLMGAIVEVHHDEKGIKWPEAVAPFAIHLVHIEDPGTEPWAEKTYEQLTKAGIEVLWDDREDVSAGEKFADADLIGIPVRLVVSAKVGEGRVEWKMRDSDKTEIISLSEAVGRLG